MSKIPLKKRNGDKKIMKETFSVIGIIASVFGLFATIVFTGYAIYHNNYSIEFKSIIIFLALSNIFLILITFYIFKNYFYLDRKYAISKEIFNNELLKYNQKIKETENEIINISIKINELLFLQGDIASIFHNILHESRKLLNNLFAEQANICNQIIANSNNVNYEFVYDDERIVKIEKSFEKYMIFLLDNIKTAFDHITGDNCRVCIKIINDENINDILSVTTYLRDSSSFRSSEIIDEALQQIPCNKNTAFMEILDSNNYKSWFLSNNLASMENYINMRPYWIKSYNACLVVPIRIKLTIPRNYSVIGFLCVDNFKGGFEDFTIDILASTGDHMYNLFSSLHELKEIINKAKNMK